MLARRLRTKQGFTLVELMIAMAIVIVLAAVAVPSYTDSMRKGRRSDAMIAMSALQLAQEKYRANNTTYGTLVQINGNATSPNGYYTLGVSNTSATGYTLTATAVPGSSQASDTTCATMTLTQAEATTSTTPTACWTK